MEGKSIYLIRHGETDYNRKGIIQGSGVDTSLNDTGRKQARAFFEHYKHISFQKIYVSTLRRTLETVAPFVAQGIPFESYAGLNEISWGSKDGKLVNKEDQRVYKEMLECWQRGEVEKCIAGGESPLDVQYRQKPIIEILLSRIDENPVLICMHGRAMRIFLSTLLHEGSLRDMDLFEHHNTCLYLLNYNGKRFNIKKFNDVSHLK